jgi:hypothetical protein
MDLGFSVADGEKVELLLSESDLVLRFLDWRATRVEYRFIDVLAFRWSARSTVETPRDDSTYEVLESSWLLDEVRLDGYSTPNDFVH